MNYLKESAKDTLLKTLDECRFKRVLSEGDIKHLLLKINSSLGEITNLAKFSEQNYHRERILIDTNMEVLILGWLNGQRSKIHDHIGSTCGVLVLQGEAIETTFRKTDNNHIYATGSCFYKQGDITTGQDEDIHQISNLASNASSLVTLHIYSPPINEFNCYQLTSQKKEVIRMNDEWFYEI